MRAFGDTCRPAAAQPSSTSLANKVCWFIVVILFWKSRRIYHLLPSWKRRWLFTSSRLQVEAKHKFSGRKKNLGKKCLGQLEGSLKYSDQPPTDIRHRFCPSVRSVLLWRGLLPLTALALARPRWLAVTTREQQKPDHEGWWCWRVEKKTSDLEKRKNARGLIFPCRYPKRCCYSTHKKGLHIYILLVSLREEQNPNVLLLAWPAIGSLCTSVFWGWAYPCLSTTDPLAGSHGIPSPTCAHTEKELWLNY